MTKRAILILTFILLYNLVFSQHTIRKESSIFFAGIFFESLNYTFPWQENKQTLVDKNFKNFSITKHAGFWVSIKLDSLSFLNGIFLSSIRISCTQRRGEDSLKVMEFVGKIDEAELLKLKNNLNYNGKVWLLCNAGVPYCRLLFFKKRHQNYMVIDRFIPV